MEACRFCTLAEDAWPDAAIYEDELVYARHLDDGEEPTYLGHAIVITKRHARSLAEATDAEARALGLLVSRVSRAIKACTGAEHVYAECYTEVTLHVHILVTARYAGTPKEYLRWRATAWPEAPRGNRGAVAELAARLRQSVSPEAHDMGSTTIVPARTA